MAMLKTGSLIVALCMGVASATVAQTPAHRTPSPKALAALDQRLQAVMDAWRPAGLAVALIADDKVVFLKGYGVRSVGHPGAVDGDTLFQLASISKPLSSALIATYVDQGRLGWSDRIADRLPGFQVADPLVTADLRLEDVLSHRSDVEATNWLIDTPNLNWRQSVDRLKTLPQQAPFRTRMIYDNFMYSVGGQAVIQLGDDYALAMKRRLFEPTGMGRSLADFESIIDPAGLAECHECELPAGAPDAFASIKPGVVNVATPHVRVKSAPSAEIHWRHVASTAASSGMSSASDMARFVRMMLNGGEIDGRRVLRSGTVAQLLARHSLLVSAPSQPTPGFAVEQARIANWYDGYALGWATGRYAGVEIRQHGGGLLGVSGVVIMAPDRKVGVVVLSNDRLYSAEVVTAAGYSALDTVLGLPAADWIGYGKVAKAREDAEIEASIPKITAPVVALTADASLAGTYCHSSYGRILVETSSEGLKASQSAQRTGKLTRVSGNRFALRWDGPRYGQRPAAFELDADGAPAALVVDGSRFVSCKAGG